MAILRRDLFRVLVDYKATMTSSLSDTLIRESKALYAEKAAIQRATEEAVAQHTESA